MMRHQNTNIAGKKDLILEKKKVLDSKMSSVILDMDGRAFCRPKTGAGAFADSHGK